MWLSPNAVYLLIAIIAAIFGIVAYLIWDEICVQKCLKCRKRILKRRESGYCPECEELVNRERPTRYYENA